MGQQRELLRLTTERADFGAPPKYFGADLSKVPASERDERTWRLNRMWRERPKVGAMLTWQESVKVAAIWNKRQYTKHSGWSREELNAHCATVQSEHPDCDFATAMLAHNDDMWARRFDYRYSYFDNMTLLLKPSGLFILDLDLNYLSGKNGVALMKRAYEQHDLNLDDECLVFTPSGGLDIVYKDDSIRHLDLKSEVDAGGLSGVDFLYDQCAAPYNRYPGCNNTKLGRPHKCGGTDSTCFFKGLEYLPNDKLPRDPPQFVVDMLTQIALRQRERAELTRDYDREHDLTRDTVGVDDDDDVSYEHSHDYREEDDEQSEFTKDDVADALTVILKNLGAERSINTPQWTRVFTTAMRICSRLRVRDTELIHEYIHRFSDQGYKWYDRSEIDARIASYKPPSEYGHYSMILDMRRLAGMLRHDVGAAKFNESFRAILAPVLSAPPPKHASSILVSNDIDCINADEVIERQWIDFLPEKLRARDFIAVQSNMGTGKTYGLRAVFREYAAWRKVIASCRRSLVKELADDLAIKYYETARDKAGYIHDKDVAVQIDSMHRVYGDIDLLVLDEIHLILAQLVSCRMPDEIVNSHPYKALLQHLKNARKIVVMDAFLSNTDVSLLESMCGRKFHVIQNTYRRFTNDVVKGYYTTGPCICTTRIMNQLDKGLKVLVPTNMKRGFAEPLYDVATRNGYKCLKITADDDKVPVSEWENYDLVIFTPTIMCGISYMGTHFDKCIAYFHNRSAGSAACVQMLKRARLVKKFRLYVCSDTFTKRVCVNRAQFDEMMRTDRATYEKYVRKYNLDINYITHSPIMDSWYELLASRYIERSRDKLNLLRRIMGLMYMQGAQCHIMNADGTQLQDNEDDLQLQCEEELEYRYKYSANTKEGRIERARDVVEAYTIVNQEEYEAIKKKPEMKRADMLSIKKYRLATEYELDFDSMARDDAIDVVKDYGTDRHIEDHRQACRTLKAGNIDALIEAHHQYIARLNEADKYAPNSQTKTHVFEVMRHTSQVAAALHCLKELGVQHFDDLPTLTFDEVDHQLFLDAAAMHEDLVNTAGDFDLKKMRRLFEERADTKKYTSFKKMFTCMLNKLLRKIGLDCVPERKHHRVDGRRTYLTSYRIIWLHGFNCPGFHIKVNPEKARALIKDDRVVNKMLAEVESWKNFERCMEYRREHMND